MYGIYSIYIHLFVGLNIHLSMCPCICALRVYCVILCMYLGIILPCMLMHVCFVSILHMYVYLGITLCMYTVYEYYVYYVWYVSYDIHLSIRPSACPSMFALSVYYVCILGLYLHMFTMYRYSAYHVYTKLYMVHLGVSICLSVCASMCAYVYTLYVYCVCMLCMYPMYENYVWYICYIYLPDCLCINLSIPLSFRPPIHPYMCA